MGMPSGGSRSAFARKERGEPRRTSARPGKLYTYPSGEVGSLKELQFTEKDLKEFQRWLSKKVPHNSQRLALAFTAWFFVSG